MFCSSNSKCGDKMEQRMELQSKGRLRSRFVSQNAHQSPAQHLIRTFIVALILLSSRTSIKRTTSFLRISSPYQKVEHVVSHSCDVQRILTASLYSRAAVTFQMPRRGELVVRRQHTQVPEQKEEQHQKRFGIQIFKQMLCFSLPALSIILADPLMSLVDAASIGLYSTTVELGALGPCMVVFNFFTYLFFFLQIATTLTVSKALAANNPKHAGEAISTSSVVALVLGLLVALVIYTSVEPLLSYMGCVPELVPYAISYMKIRVFAQPAVLVSQVWQSGLLAQGDAATPAQAIALACAVNVLGDLFLVRFAGWGIQGAAVATVVAQLLQLPFLLWRGYYSHLKDKIRIQWHVPSRPELKSFVASFGPLFCFQASLNICWTAIQSLSTTFSANTAAAHQAAWSIFALLTFVPFPLQQCVQVFLPKYLNSESCSHPLQRRGTKVVQVLLAMGTTLGISTSVLCILALYNPFFLTNDVILWPIIKSFSPFVPGALLCTGFAAILDGILMVMNDLSYLAKGQCVVMIVLLLYLQCAAKGGWGILSVWVGLNIFQFSRLLVMGPKVSLHMRSWAKSQH